MSPITRYDFANIGVKLLALYLFVSFLSDLPSWGMVLDQAVSMGSDHGLAFLIFLFCLPLLGLEFPIALWCLAGPIARLMSKSEDKTTSETGNDLLITLLIAIGILLLALSVPKLLVLLSIVIQNQAHSFASSLPQLIAYGGQFMLSLFLIFGASPIGRFIHRVRYHGSGKAS